MVKKQVFLVITSLVLLSSLFAIIFLSKDYIFPMFQTSLQANWFSTTGFMFILFSGMVAFMFCVFIAYALMKIVRSPG